MTASLYKYIVPFRYDLFRLPKNVSIFETELQSDLNLRGQYEDPTTETESVENFNECVASIAWIASSENLMNE